MKSLVCVAALVCLSCTVLFAQSSGNSAQTSGSIDSGSKEGCATPNPASGYAPPTKLPKSKREINVYNVDYPEPYPHPPICLSKMADDTLLWVSGSSKRFKIKIYLEKGQNPNCGQHPFRKEPPSDTVDGWFSGSLNPSVPDNCLYEVEFQLDGGTTSDPHIRTKQ